MADLLSTAPPDGHPISLAWAVPMSRGPNLGIMVNRAAASYRGAGRICAKDALIIADQARMRRDLTILHGDDELVIELRARRPASPAFGVTVGI